jgi:hypothetical protein
MVRHELLEDSLVAAACKESWTRVSKVYSASKSALTWYEVWAQIVQLGAITTETMLHLVA